MPHITIAGTIFVSTGGRRSKRSAPLCISNTAISVSEKLGLGMLLPQIITVVQNVDLYETECSYLGSKGGDTGEDGNGKVVANNMP